MIKIQNIEKLNKAYLNRRAFLEEQLNNRKNKFLVEKFASALKMTDLCFALFSELGTVQK
jgi:hypothetical protein